jgi:hypothetical protein
MADPIPGELEDWTEIEPNRWERTGHPEDGVITVTPPLTFEQYYAERASDEADLKPAPEDLPPSRAEFDALEARVAALEAKS